MNSNFTEKNFDLLISVIRELGKWVIKKYYVIKHYLFNPVQVTTNLNNCKISLRFQSQYFKIKFIKAIVTSDFKDVYLNINSSKFGSHNINLNCPLEDYIGVKIPKQNAEKEEFCIINVKIYYKILFFTRCYKRNLLVEEKYFY